MLVVESGTWPENVHPLQLDLRGSKPKSPHIGSHAQKTTKRGLHSLCLTLN